VRSANVEDSPLRYSLAYPFILPPAVRIGALPLVVQNQRNSPPLGVRTRVSIAVSASFICLFFFSSGKWEPNQQGIAHSMPDRGHSTARNGAAVGVGAPTPGGIFPLPSTSSAAALPPVSFVGLVVVEVREVEDATALHHTIRIGFGALLANLLGASQRVAACGDEGCNGRDRFMCASDLSVPAQRSPVAPRVAAAQLTPAVCMRLPSSAHVTRARCPVTCLPAGAVWCGAYRLPRESLLPEEDVDQTHQNLILTCREPETRRWRHGLATGFGGGQKPGRGTHDPRSGHNSRTYIGNYCYYYMDGSDVLVHKQMIPTRRQLILHSACTCDCYRLPAARGNSTGHSTGGVKFKAAAQAAKL
jgi:hypothetical protein